MKDPFELPKKNAFLGSEISLVFPILSGLGYQRRTERSCRPVSNYLHAMLQNVRKVRFECRVSELTHLNTVIQFSEKKN